MERGLPGILFYEDHVHMSPYMHTDQDVVGVSLNSDTLFEANVRAAAATLFTLARPVHPPPILLTVQRLPGDPLETARLDWTGGFPGYDVHKAEAASDVREEANRYRQELFATDLIDDRAAGSLLFYSVEEFP